MQREFEELYNSIYEAILPTIANITGCQCPCSYLEIGLFVGFSFMAFWDCLEFVLKMFGNFTSLKIRNKSEYKYV